MTQSVAQSVTQTVTQSVTPTDACARLRGRRLRRAMIATAVLTAATTARGEALPFRRYDVSDGLAHSRVETIFQDSRGYLWFGTWEGLSRFDGYRFARYGAREGLRNPIVAAIGEDPHGRIWVGTYGSGLERLVEDPREARALRERGLLGPEPARFRVFPLEGAAGAPSITGLSFDSEGTLWCTGTAGLARILLPGPGGDGGTGPVESPHVEVLGTVASLDPSVDTTAGPPGSGWFGLHDRVVRVVRGEGRAARLDWYPPPPASGAGSVTAIVFAGPDSLFIARKDMVLELRPGSTPRSARWRALPIPLRPSQEVRALAVEPDGALWVGTTRGLLRHQGGRTRLYTVAEGLADDFVRALAFDREGNLWIGTNGGGVCKLGRQRIISYYAAHGLPDQNVSRLVEDHRGRIYASTVGGGVVEVLEDRAVLLPGSDAMPFGRMGYRFAQDRFRDWWVGTDEGLWRIPGPDPDFSRAQRLGPSHGFSDAGVFDGQGIYPDAVGNVWVGGLDMALYVLRSGSRHPPRFERLPLSGFEGTSRMLADRSGSLWLASAVALGRLRGGRVELLAASPGLPETRPRALFLDGRGRLWIGLRFSGLSVTDDPLAERPVFRNMGTRDGLSSDTVWSLAESAQGQIYAGTGRGLDVLEPSTGRIRHLTSRDGLAGDLVNSCLRDGKDRIWIATTSGLSRLDPRPEVSGPSPPVYIRRVEIAGESLPLPESGARHVEERTLPPSSDNLMIEYVGLSFGAERALRYQYRLEGVDRGWSAPRGMTRVQYARLAPGRYRFAVRALGPGGETSLEPATMRFRILPPVWRRRWFLALATAAVAGLVYGVHRARIRRVLALERIRRQIATDLHDDLGAGLSQIAILSEVARRETSAPVAVRLGELAELARAMRESMSDIVWAVDPRKDRLSDLVHRMRQVAHNLLVSHGLRVSFHAPDEDGIERIALPPDRRRHLLLVFKETVHNVARHAAANEVTITLEVEAGELRLSVTDDGRGFDTAARHEGLGLESLHRRAKELGGTLVVESSPGCGTRVELRVPMRVAHARRGGGARSA